MRRRQDGFTYLAILFLVSVLGVGLAAVGEVWDTARRRDKERDLLQAGRDLRDAIGRYYTAPSGGTARYPSSLEDLLKDNRVPGIRRHMRRIPVDPMTGKADWATLGAPGGGIAGVHSRSEDEPLKTANFDRGEDGFEGGKQYSEWRFLFVPDPKATLPAIKAAR
ncbi:type II secretion system protein [Sulfuritalea sp.]|uniref:type II secretion system protein n=1 Tax=Sulfuritalea sp. TaxID=2480090 RepID=UPI00286E4437|nr:type II secretion system protein [Sulfuritalea sp.]